MDSRSDSARGFDFLAIFVKSVCDDCFRAIFVGCYLLRGKLRSGIVELFVISPIWAITTKIRDGQTRGKC